MKHAKIILATALFTMTYACGGMSENSKDNEQTLQETKVIVTEETKPASTEQIEVKNDITRYKFQCLINDKIPVDMTFETKDDITQGQIVYNNTKAKKPIRLLGEVIHSENGSEQLSFREMTSDGTTTGQITGKINNQGNFEGTWSEPCKFKEEKTGFTYIDGKQFPIRTVKIVDKNTQLSSDKIFSWKINTQNTEGKYYYSVGENCNSGTLKIFHKENQLLCTINASASAPSFNMADVENQKCEWQGNHLVCAIPDWEGCKFAIYPFEDFAIIKYIDNQNDCGFGRRATVDGIFLKIK